MSDLGKKIQQIEDQRARFAIEESIALQKAFASDDVDAIMKAQSYYSKNIDQRKKENIKTVLLDPMDITSSFGYKDKPFSVSYDVLRAMARTHIVKSIIDTRKEQVSAFCQPQENKYSTGFIVRKRISLSDDGDNKEETKAEKKRAAAITEFLINCGSESNYWHADSFDVFVKKLLDDSLTLDQGTFEIVRNRRGDVVEFLATDGGTMRIADSYDDDEYVKKEDLIKGYAPSYVQVIDNAIQTEYYPWELCFGIRNPSTNIRTNGYGRSELEDAIQTVTAILNADTYNANFFKVGSAPKGILKYTGSINENTVQDFRRQWMAQTAGVLNMHKIPMINAEKLDFINTHISNKDMEYAKYHEFLIKIMCAMYKIDPAEIGFPMSGNIEAKPMFEGNNESRLKYSKDKGLKPLLKQLERWINKYIVWQIDDKYEFKFVGIDGEMTYQEELDADIKLSTSVEEINEVRKRRGLPEKEGYDFIASSAVLQKMNIDQQQAMMNQQQQQNPYDEYEDYEQGDEDQDDSNIDFEDEENPFNKALKNELAELLS